MSSFSNLFYFDFWWKGFFSFLRCTHLLSIKTCWNQKKMLQWRGESWQKVKICFVWFLTPWLALSLYIAFKDLIFSTTCKRDKYSFRLNFCIITAAHVLSKIRVLILSVKTFIPMIPKISLPYLTKRNHNFYAYIFFYTFGHSRLKKTWQKSETRYERELFFKHLMLARLHFRRANPPKAYILTLIGCVYF